MKWSNLSKCLVVLATIGLVCGPSWAAPKEGKPSSDAPAQGKADQPNQSGSRGATSWNFDKEKVGAVPTGWKVAETGSKGKPGKWEVIADATAPSAPNVVALTKTQNTGNTFNLLMAEGAKLKDLDLEVKVRVISGKKYKGSGLVWRAVDPNNYYLARWTPLSKNIRVYCIKDGKPKRLATVNVKVDPNAWHTIKVNHQGDKIVASLDGKKLIDVNDTTLANAGTIGLCTRADAVAAFDDLRVRGIRPQSPRPERAEPNKDKAGIKDSNTKKANP
jgi:hypothetical protein